MKHFVNTKTQFKYSLSSCFFFGGGELGDPDVHGLLPPQASEKSCLKFRVNKAPPWSSLLEVQISRVYFDSITF